MYQYSKIIFAFYLVFSAINYLDSLQASSFDKSTSLKLQEPQAANQWPGHLSSNGFEQRNYLQQQLHHHQNHEQQDRTRHATSSNHQGHQVHQTRGGPSLAFPANNRLSHDFDQVHLASLSSQMVPSNSNLTLSSDNIAIAISEHQQPLGSIKISHGQQLAPQRDDYRHVHHSNDKTSNNLGDFLMPSNLELALRQASGDESVFQPSPTIGAPGHNNFDWHAPTAPNGHNTINQIAGPSQNSNDLSHLAKSNRAPATTLEPATTATISTTAMTTTSTTTTTAASSRPTIVATTELNNHLMNNQVEPVVLNHHQSILSHQKEYQTSLNSTSLDFNNQVLYEGPVTSPQSTASSSDYYFSSSEKMNKDVFNESNGHVPSTAWWALGIGQEFELINNLTRDNYLDYCEKSALLINNKQRSLCRMHPRVMSIVARGLKMAIDECQARFSSSRWNCSIVVHNSIRRLADYTDNETASNEHQLQQQETIFGDVMKRPNRERSFLNAIIAASLAHSMTKACSQGELPEECSCDKKIKSKNSRGRIEWVACSDDIDYGARFSREFTDNFNLDESDAVSTIYMHNSEVGRRIFKSATDITCTCSNSDSGSCQTKRCWRHLGSFTDVVDELIRRYDGATHVQRSNKDPHKLRPVRRGVRRPKRRDLVYIEESPDYCQPDYRIGVMGTQDRLCNSTSQGPDSCLLLCCGRGFQRVVEQVEEDCNCKFVWCCQVKCDKCKRYVTNDVCN